MFEVNIIDIVLVLLLLTFTPFSTVSIVDFKQVNVSSEPGKIIFLKTIAPDIYFSDDSSVNTYCK